MNNKKEIQEPGLGTKDAKELELDEQPKPTRKVSHPATPILNKEEPSTPSMPFSVASLEPFWKSKRLCRLFTRAPTTQTLSLI